MAHSTAAPLASRIVANIVASLAQASPSGIPSASALTRQALRIDASANALPATLPAVSAYRTAAATLRGMAIECRQRGD